MCGACCLVSSIGVMMHKLLMTMRLDFLVSQQRTHAGRVM